MMAGVVGVVADDDAAAEKGTNEDEVHMDEAVAGGTAADIVGVADGEIDGENY